MTSQQNKILKIFSSKVFAVIMLSLILLISIGLYKDYIRRQQFSAEIKKLEARLGELEGRKVELSKLVDILSSARYIEKEARIRFGLKKEGEKVISVPDDAKPQVLGVSDMVIKYKPNYIQWFEYFFNPQNSK